MTEPWHTVNELILFSVLFDAQLGDAAVTRVAQRAIAHPDAHLTTEQIYTGIAGALRSPEPLAASVPGNRHGEHEYRDFLARVLQRLDELRPWPERPFQAIDPGEWPDLGHARLVARVTLGIAVVQERLRQPFGQVASGGDLVMTLRLRSGAEVALVPQWWPGSDDVALLLRGPHRDPAGLVAEFCMATGIMRYEVTAASQ
jgi:hypothetical protein